MNIKLGLASMAVLAAIALPAYAMPVVFHANLSGANELPANASTATGTALVTFDDVANTMQVDIVFAGLSDVASAGHIHCCTPVPGVGNVSVAVGFTDFPAAASGTYSKTFDLSLDATYTNPFRNGPGGGTAAGAEAALLAGLLGGQAYANIHDSKFPGGEIRGFLIAEPAPFALAMLALGGLAFTRRSSARRQ